MNDENVNNEVNNEATAGAFSILYEKGFHFIPVDSEKLPAKIDGAKVGVTQATRDKQLLTNWASFGFDFGCAGGKVEGSDLYLVIIDVDIKKENGHDTIKLLEQDYGELPSTLTVRSRSGGQHLYYLCDEPIGSMTDAFGKKLEHDSGVDIRGVNGYCVCPPAPGYTLEKNVEPAKLPVEWKLLLKSLVDFRSQSITEKYSMPRYPQIVTDFNKDVSIHDALLNFGYEKTGNRTYMHPFGATTRYNVVIMENKGYLKHGSKFVSHHFGAHDEIQKGPHDAFDIYRILQCEGDWDLAALSLKRIKSDEHGRIFCRANQVQHYPRQEIVASHVRVEDLCMLTGFSETLKTFFIMDLCFSCACGLPFLNYFPVYTKEGPLQSAMILTESIGDFSDRREAWVKYRSEQTGISKAELHKRLANVFVYFSPYIVTNAESVKVFNKLSSQFTGFKPKIWVFDHFSNNYEGDENDNNMVAAYLNVLREKARREKSVVFVLHHPPKGGTSHSRGASVLLNNVPLSYHFERAKKDRNNPVTVELEKCSYYNGFKRYALKENRFDLYLDTHSVEIKHRTGLALSYQDASDLPDDIGNSESKIANEHKVKILNAMADCEITTADAAEIIDRTKPIASSLMKSLLDAGEVTHRKHGKTDLWKKVTLVNED